MDGHARSAAARLTSTVGSDRQHGGPPEYETGKIARRSVRTAAARAFPEIAGWHAAGVIWDRE